jgi:parallel beta-helix repeat protein
MIQKNNFTSNSYGVYLTFNESLTYIGWSFDNQIVKNYFLNNTYGIYSNIGSATFVNSQFNTTILENEMRNNVYGIFLYLSPVNKILENTISQNDYGLHIELSSGNSITNNSIAENRMNGLTLHLASDNFLISNNITNSDVGVTLSLSSDNLIYRNVIADNRFGMDISLSSDNTIYNNDFVGNVQQVVTDGLSSNKWNSTYPSGGNYWSDYTGTDRYSGPYQNETGSDGIGDTPYIIDINELFGTYNIDYYPLMKPCIVECYALTIISEVGGTTNPVPGTYTYVNGTSVQVTAIPDNGYSFDYWMLDGFVREENPITVIMTSNHNLTAYFVDDIAPEIGDPSQNPPPDNVQPFQNVTVLVNVIDYGTGIHNVTLWYSLDNGTSWTPLNMTEISAGTYQATILGHENGTWVSYKIVAYDNAGNNATKDNNGYYYKYHVIPEFPSTIILPLLMLTTLIATVLLKKKRKTKLQLP